LLNPIWLRRLLTALIGRAMAAWAASLLAVPLLPLLLLVSLAVRCAARKAT